MRIWHGTGTGTDAEKTKQKQRHCANSRKRRPDRTDQRHPRLRLRIPQRHGAGSRSGIKSRIPATACRQTSEDDKVLRQHAADRRDCIRKARLYGCRNSSISQNRQMHLRLEQRMAGNSLRNPRRQNTVFGI